MTPIGRIAVTCIIALAAAGCSVISSEVRKEAGPPVSFPHLLAHTEGYMGQTIILGGYIVSVRNITGKSVITVLQSPLRFGDEPTVRDNSQGRFTVIHDGHLDPEVYAKDRRVTVAGTVIRNPGGIEQECPLGCPFIRSREIHLWRQYPPRHYYDDWYYPRHHFNLYYHHGYRHRYYRTDCSVTLPGTPTGEALPGTPTGGTLRDASASPNGDSALRRNHGGTG